MKRNVGTVGKSIEREISSLDGSLPVGGRVVHVVADMNRKLLTFTNDPQETVVVHGINGKPDMVMAPMEFQQVIRCGRGDHERAPFHSTVNPTDSRMIHDSHAEFRRFPLEKIAICRHCRCLYAEKL